MKTRFILLTLACLLAAAPATAQVNYNISAIGSVVTRSPNASGDIVIASTYLGDTVTWIVGCAFCGCTNLTSVTIPNGVTGVGQQAFSGCTNLTSVTMGNSVTSMGTTLYSGPFDGCTSLTNFSVDASNPAFSSLDGVVFDKAQTTLILFPPGRSGSYVIPASVTNIGIRAFAGCTRLTNVTIGNGVTSFGVGAFSGCTTLTSATIPNNVTNIADRAFENCTSLTSVTIPNGVVSIGNDAFNGCTSLTSVTIPNSVTQIGTTLYAGGGNAFANCTSLT